jgi:hypothetical protein
MVAERRRPRKLRRGRTQYWPPCRLSVGSDQFIPARCRLAVDVCALSDGKATVGRYSSRRSVVQSESPEPDTRHVDT